MSLLRKSNIRHSSRRQIAIKGVDDGILILPGDKYRLILETSSINFELRSEDEQDALIEMYQAFLNSIATPLQILIRVREMDMETYLAAFRLRVNDEKTEIYKEQARRYCDFVESLVMKNKILTRHFYVVIPYTGETTATLVSIREQLQLSYDIISKGLAKLGVHTRKLSSLEVLDLFYRFYSPVTAKRQSLSEQTMQLMKEALL